MQEQVRNKLSRPHDNMSRNFRTSGKSSDKEKLVLAGALLMVVVGTNLWPSCSSYIRPIIITSLRPNSINFHFLDLHNMLYFTTNS